MRNKCQTPQAIGSPPQAYAIALAMLKAAGAKRVLDCPAGEGPFSAMLREHGYDVVAADICPDQFRVKEISCDFADLNDHLPYADNSFDGISCLNGLQRVWARGRAVKEFARILRPGGTAVISFPNNSDIRRRLMFFLTGSVTWNVIGPPHVCDPDAASPASSFRYGMTLPNVLSALTSVGLGCHTIRATHRTIGAILLSPLALGPITFSVLAPRRYGTVFDRELFKLRANSSIAALFGSFLVVSATKPLQG
jgi:SAM-dependent methyltransferase